MTKIDGEKDTFRTLMTIDEVGDFLRVNARTVYRLIQAGELPAARVGRQWRVRREDLERWLDRGEAMHPAV